MSTGRFETYQREFRRQFEPALQQYLRQERRRLERIHPQGEELSRAIENFTVRSGKRLRATLVSLGYELAQGKSTKRILQAAIAVELLHSFLLVHDDIMDQSALRRGKPTVHQLFGQRYGRRFGLKPTDRQHLGASLGIVAGDLGFSLALRALLTSDFPERHLHEAVMNFLAMTDRTIIGQTLDLIQPLRRGVKAEEAKAIMRLKTASYSIVGPLRLGMILGGAGRRQISQIERFAVPVGVAFQIQDDILGVFGSERQVGKPVTSDLEEGKQTLLVVYAREHGTPAQRRRLEAIVGKKHLTKQQLNEAQKIFRETGARQRCERQARALVQQGQRSLTQMAVKPRIRQLLFAVAEFMITRTM